ncbi:28S ribosomal protein S30, mitochondrial [Lucilia sericata]|uniref:28S ribosomal protein S30, mitochondrial n=1 Tax=Lucilia sericata TaxID=13632 RepID=UPI0018A7EEF2|nr:28S ribosomal protein S30, mitochondrial [Lucilia sericata]
MLLMRRAESLTARCASVCRNYIATPKNAQAASAAPQTAVTENDEYFEVAQYPEIKDPSFTARKEREALSFQEQVQKAATVEEKMIKINMPRYYGYKVVQLHDERLPYNCLPAIQHYTRTLYENMPSELKADEKLNSYVETLKGDIQEALEVAHDYFNQKYPDASDLEPKERERILTQVIVEQINRALINGLSADYQHLQEAEIDYNPRHEAFWSVGGIQAPKNIVKAKEGHEWQKHLAKEPVDRLMQYKSEPMLALRHRLQLSSWKTEEESNNIELANKVPRLEFDPRSLGFTTGYQHGTNIAGHWPSNMAGFGLLSYQSRAGFHIRPQSSATDDHNEALHAHAIQSSFAWLLAQANYNGFNTFSELTYPLNTQTIITDGKTWSFYEYQLNTLLMNGRQINENPRVNYCRGTPELALYQEIDENGKIIGFNDEVLKYLVSYYTNAPNVQRSAEELQPFLDSKYKRIVDYEDEEKREFLEKTFKHLVSNRPRHLALPEIYLWEKLYKIDNKTRPLEAKRRYFELFYNPWKRTLDQHQKEYISRKVRPEGPKSKKKWKNTYYPQE